MENNMNELTSNDLFKGINQTHSIIQKDLIKLINLNITIRNWLIGFYIVEYEQKAKHNNGLLDEIALKLKTKNIKGVDIQMLQCCKAFYNTYPQLWNEVLTTFVNSDKTSDILQWLNNKKNRVSVTPKFGMQPMLLLSQLSFAHFIELIKIDDPVERAFYEVESIKNNWHVKQLSKAIDSNLYVNTGASADKNLVLSQIKTVIPPKISDIIIDPHALDFLGIEEKSEFV